MKNLLYFVLILGAMSLACTRNTVTPTKIGSTVTPIVTQTVTCTPTLISATPVKITIDLEVGVHIRSDSNEHGEDLGVIPDGAEIEIIGEKLENGWICVKWGDLTGYVNSKYLNLP